MESKNLDPGLIPLTIYISAVLGCDVHSPQLVDMLGLSCIILCIFQLHLDTIWTVIFNVPISKSVSALMSDNSIHMCSDAALILLAMVRSLLNPVSTFFFCLGPKQSSYMLSQTLQTHTSPCIQTDFDCQGPLQIHPFLRIVIFWSLLPTKIMFFEKEQKVWIFWIFSDCPSYVW